MSKRKIPDTGGRDVWFEVGTFSLDGVRSFRFLKKERKNTLWINKFRTFLFVFDSHIGIILILYVVVYANCKNICRNVLETWQWYNFNKKFTYLVGNKKYQKVLEKSLEKWSRYAKTIFWLHFKIKLA